VRRCIAIAACLVATAAFADDGNPAQWYLRVDNDFFFHTDRWYTSGFRIARVQDGLEWGLVQEIYTPEAKYLSPTLQDRAPVGRLFASVANHIEGDDTVDTYEIDAGVRGPSALGEQTQGDVHGVVESGVKLDWSRQLPDKFDASAIGVRTQYLGYGFRGHLGAVVGTQMIFGHLGVEWRIGDTQAPSSPLMRYAATPPFRPRAGGFGAYLGASIRGVARNELLSKNYYTYGPELEKKNEVTRLGGGFTWSQGWGNLTLDLVQESREFVGQRTAHEFGSIALHIAF
jgi:hypothetical protein